MSQLMIVARMRPEDAGRVAEVFGRYDATEMPHQIGVSRRALYRFHELYMHLIDFDRPPGEAMAVAQSLPAFRAVSGELAPFINAYDPAWRSPSDAMARCFYQWTPEGGVSDGDGPLPVAQAAAMPVRL